MIATCGKPVGTSRRSVPCRLGKDHAGDCSAIPTQAGTQRTLMASESLLLNQSQHGLEAVIYENGFVRFVAVRPENGAWVPESVGPGIPHGYPVGDVMIDALIATRRKLMGRAARKAKRSGGEP